MESRASSALLFSAGLRRGAVVGETGDRGKKPIDRPVSPESLFNTLLQALQVDTDTALTAPNGCPVQSSEAVFALAQLSSGPLLIGGLSLTFAKSTDE